MRGVLADVIDGQRPSDVVAQLQLPAVATSQANSAASVRQAITSRSSAVRSKPVARTALLTVPAAALAPVVTAARPLGAEARALPAFAMIIRKYPSHRSPREINSISASTSSKYRPRDSTAAGQGAVNGSFGSIKKTCSLSGSTMTSELGRTQPPMSVPLLMIRMAQRHSRLICSLRIRVPFTEPFQFLFPSGPTAPPRLKQIEQQARNRRDRRRNTADRRHGWARSAAAGTGAAIIAATFSSSARRSASLASATFVGIFAASYPPLVARPITTPAITWA